MKAFIMSSPMGIPIDGSRACPILLRHEKATVLLHNTCILEYDYELDQVRSTLPALELLPLDC